MLFKRVLYLRLVIVSFVLLINSLQGFSQSKRSLLVSHKIVPATVTIDGRSTLYYELYLQNISRDSILIKGISSQSKKVMTASYDETDVTERFVNRSRKKSTRPLMAPGDSAVVYIETQFPGPPAILDHGVHFEVVGTDEPRSISGPRVNCSTAQAVILAPPLGRGNWAAVYDPSWLRGHRRVLFEVNGKERIPGRFAIDFILLDNEGKYFKGDEDQVLSWLGYGVDVLAVADGTIASVNTDFPESETISKHPSYPADKATGNYISIDIGQGRFAFYEHLKPGSITVTPGQKVKKGDIIGSLGFTGQSTGPHLHFHVADANSPLGAEGIPFVFQSFELLGSYPDFSKFGKEKWLPPISENNMITNERPAPNTVIRF